VFHFLNFLIIILLITVILLLSINALRPVIGIFDFLYFFLPCWLGRRGVTDHRGGDRKQLDGLISGMSARDVFILVWDEFVGLGDYFYAVIWLHRSGFDCESGLGSFIQSSGWFMPYLDYACLCM